MVIPSAIPRVKANSIHTILNFYAVMREQSCTPEVPETYKYPFPKNQCIYCQGPPGKGIGDHFIPITLGGRVNNVSIVPCCRECNTSKGQKTDSALCTWLKCGGHPERRISHTRIKEILKWWDENDKYMHIHEDEFKKYSDDLDNDIENLLKFHAEKAKDIYNFIGKKVGGRYNRGYVTGIVENFNPKTGRYIIVWDDGLEEEMTSNQVMKRVRTQD
jgi:hypothetical protein